MLKHEIPHLRWLQCNMMIFLIICAYLALPDIAHGSQPCSSPFKIYVYDLPSSLLSAAEHARSNLDYHMCKKCIYEQFSLEYIVYDYFTQHCGRTSNPEEADYFYLPIIREIDYRIALTRGRGNRKPSAIESALLAALEEYDFTRWHEVFNVTDRYWRRHNGSDHILVMPAPVTNLRHETNMRGFFHYMLQLHPPLFLNVEYSKAFVEEYPVCAREKNIVMPYPTIDPDFYTGKLLVKGYPDTKRDKLLFYLGGNHGSCVHVRQALTNVIRDPKYAIQRGQRKREEGFQSAVFCPIPIGDSPSSKRMYDAMHFGCIPVVLSDDLVWAYSIQAGGPLDPTSFSIHLPQAIVQKSASYIVSNLIPMNQSSTKINTGARSSTGAALPSSTSSFANLNLGQLLPSGTNLYDILLELAEEEEERRRRALLLLEGASTAAVNRRIATERVDPNEFRIWSARNSNNSSNSSGFDPQSGGGGGGGDGFVKAETAIDTNTSDSLALLVEHLQHYNRLRRRQSRRLQRSTGKRSRAKVDAMALASRRDGALPEGIANTLVRLLQKISPKDIASLQAGVHVAARNYRYYEMQNGKSSMSDNTSKLGDKSNSIGSKMLTHFNRPSKPLPATHTPPNGQAMQVLQELLAQRKEKGLNSIYTRCQSERNRKDHKYVGRYPCEKRRMLLECTAAGGEA
mmetsp:Transcript_28061/g.47194  ORF Transcript_28061/g.47194 Transcript_28061/m.47194 type:complete len:683 (+) Transcript_28061:66-2114(+)